jgi:RNA-binding protein
MMSGKARRHLRALGHHLQPVVQVGKEGLSPALILASQAALATHELIKVRLGENAEGDRHELAASLAASTKSELAGQIGRTLLLYRRHPSQPKIALPSAP